MELPKHFSLQEGRLYYVSLGDFKTLPEQNGRNETEPYVDVYRSFQDVTQLESWAN